MIKPLGPYSLTIVTEENFLEVANKFRAWDSFTLDVETTGLSPYACDRLFSFAICNENEVYYFNFNTIPDNVGKVAPVILPRQYIPALGKYLDFPSVEYINHNVKFDLHFLAAEGLVLKNVSLFCTEVMARLINNHLPNYKLKTLSKLIGHYKSDAVEEYIKKHKLYRNEENNKKSKSKVPRFELVPFEIMAQYCAHDAWVTFQLAKYEKRRLAEISAEQVALGVANINQVVETEKKVTRVLFEMEREGVLVDREYTKEAFLYHCDKYERAAEEITALTGIEFEDGSTVLKEIFTKLGLRWGTAGKGGASFADDALPDHEISELIRKYRKSYKAAHTYYENFLKLSDKDGKLHTNFNQSGTNTGRLSAMAPNLQNVPKRGEDNEEYKARACIICEPDYFFFMPDYDQMEYRMLLDIAEESSVIEKVLCGLDVHTATADDMGVDRFAAKTLNFMLLYGGGAAKLAGELGVTLYEAKKKKNLYFKTLGNVSALVSKLIEVVEKRGHITNWYGRLLRLPPQGSYAIANHYIQGGCADIVKIAMVELSELLKDKKSKMLLQVHDEILFKIHYSEVELVTEINRIMREAYPAKRLPLTTGFDYSFSNWYEKEGAKCYEDLKTGLKKYLAQKNQ